jgi:hypothetical protein
MADEVALLALLGYAEGTLPARPGGGVTVSDGVRRRIRLVGGFGPEVRWIDERGDLVGTWRSASPTLAGGRPALWRSTARVGSDVLVVADDAALLRLGPHGERWRSPGRFHHAVLPRSGETAWALERSVGVRGVAELLTAVRLADGAVLRRCALDAPLRAAGLIPGPGPDPWHVNGLAACGEHLLLSARNVDLVLRFDPAHERVLDAWSGPWHRQHDPHLLADGTISLFDNRGAAVGSRVLRFDPRAGSSATVASGFDAPWCGAATPLPDGGWLVTDSVVGRLVEVDAAGAARWCWESPWTTPDGRRTALIAEGRPDGDGILLDRPLTGP